MVINLFSDTATKPTPAMLQAMIEAEVGDEQLREDPTVNALQDEVAALTGKEGGLFLPSGTMCNIIAFLLHCQRGDTVILDARAHPATSEAGGPAVFANVLLKPLHGTDRGRYTGDDVVAAIVDGGTHASGTSLVSIENTTNAGGGAVWNLGALQDIQTVARDRGLKTHMDGARLMNAVVASGVSARDFASTVDSVWIDLSKGLGCPIGAVLCGSAEFIERGRIWKHRLGGAMRQAGVIAAAGRYAFAHHVERLAEDHANARILEAGLSEIDGITLVNGPTMTNILFFALDLPHVDSADFSQRLRERGVILSGGYPTGSPFRAVTHLDVSQEDCETAVAVIDDVVRDIKG